MTLGDTKLGDLFVFRGSAFSSLNPCIRLGSTLRGPPHSEIVVVVVLCSDGRITTFMELHEVSLLSSTEGASG